MEHRTYRTTEFAKLAGVTARALHYYDRLGLLTPSRTEEGHRVYSGRDLESLERIVALKRIGLPLKKIAELRDAQPLELANTLAEQRGALAEKRRLLDQAIAANWELEATVRSGGRPDGNTFKRTIEVLEDRDIGNDQRREYDSLLKAKRGALRNRAQQSLTTEQKALGEQLLLLMQDIAEALSEDPASPRAQDLAGRWITLMSPQWPPDRPAPANYVCAPVPAEGLAASDEQLIRDETARYHGWPQRPAPDVQRYSEFIRKVLAVRQAG